ncbi:MAG: hemolysin family protein [Phycisphaeraceae bacterium]
MPLLVTLELLLLPVLLVASGFFSGSETALFSLSQHQRVRLARDEHLTGRTITTLLAETRSLLITLLLGNMTINVLFFVISSVLLLQLQRTDWAGAVIVTLASVLPLLAIILLGEVLPKLIAARLTVGWARFCALPLYVVHRVIAPVRIFAHVAVITPLARLIAPRRTVPALSEDELESLLTLSQRQGLIDPDEEQLLQQVLELSQLKVRDLMVPRVDMRAFDLESDPAELVELARTHGMSQIPVYEGDLDHIAGVVHARQLLLREPTTRDDVRKLVRQVKFVPEQQRGDQLLVEMRKTGATFAIIVDEYGGTAGLVTLEDVVEHMVGDIAGPFEAAGEPEIEHFGANRWRASAWLSVHEWADFFGHDSTIEGVATLDAVSTVGGLVMARLGRVPQPGDRVNVGNVQITVERMNGRRIESVLIELRHDQPPDDETDTQQGPRPASS